MLGIIWFEEKFNISFKSNSFLLHQDECYRRMSMLNLPIKLSTSKSVTIVVGLIEVVVVSKSGVVTATTSNVGVVVTVPESISEMIISVVVGVMVGTVTSSVVISDVAKVVVVTSSSTEFRQLRYI